MQRPAVVRHPFATHVLGGVLLVGCSTSSPGETAGPGGGAGPTVEPGTCRYRVSGATNDLVDVEGQFDFEGSTLIGRCFTSSAAGYQTHGEIQLKAYDGPGQTATLDAGEAWGKFGFVGNDGFTYSSVFDAPRGQAPGACTVTVVSGPESPQVGPRLHLTLACGTLYGYGDTTADVHRVSISEGDWEAPALE